MKIFRMLFLICLAVSLPAAAQEKSKPAAKEEKSAKAAAAMPAMKPAPEMQKLAKAMVGHYTTKETHEAGPFVPTGGTGVGEATFMLGPGGN